MSADGHRCECGRLAIASLRVAGVREPICADCLGRIAPPHSRTERKSRG